MKPIEQDTNYAGNVCFDPDTLFRLAGRTVRMLGIPARWREDAVAEYVLAAYAAGQKADCTDDIQSRQCQLGRRAAIDFARRERRQESLSPGSCAVGAKLVSLEKMIRMRDGEVVPMVETIKDVNAPNPDDRMLETERRTAVERAVKELDPVAKEVIRMVWEDGMTQEETADALGLSRMVVRWMIYQSRSFLRKRLAGYGIAFKSRRAKKNNRPRKRFFLTKNTLRSDYESIGERFSADPEEPPMPDDDDPPDLGGTDPPPEDPIPSDPDPPIPEEPVPATPIRHPRKPRQPRKPRPPKLVFVPPPPPASLEEVIREAITGPKSVTVDGQNVTAHDLRQLIDLDRYLESKKAAGKPGIRFTKLVPPGAG